jgi:hypothetical protein
VINKIIDHGKPQSRVITDNFVTEGGFQIKEYKSETVVIFIVIDRLVEP